jgi:hypothetical protein
MHGPYSIGVDAEPREHPPRVTIRKDDDLLGLANVELIDSSGEKLGVMTPADALRLAREQGLDLVEVNPKAKPPVCKILDLARFMYDARREAASRQRGEPEVFLVRSKLVAQGRPGSYLIGDLVSGEKLRAGMLAHIPSGPDEVHAVQILAVEFVDHVGDKTSELGLLVVGDTPQQAAAIEALEGAHLIEITERLA